MMLKIICHMQHYESLIGQNSSCLFCLYTLHYSGTFRRGLKSEKLHLNAAVCHAKLKQISHS